MRIGYVSTNIGLGCTSAKTFRLASFSEARFTETVGNNLLCLRYTLYDNLQRGVYFFRITSDLVPFASHEVCTIPWQRVFARQFAEIGAFARRHNMRLAMHPGQYTLVNAPSEAVFARSVAELVYHAEVMDLLGMDAAHRIQIHVGGVYGDKAASLARFVERFPRLPEPVQRRLVVENDDRLYTVRDCVWLYEQIGTPVVFDNLHYALNNDGEPLVEAFALAHATWGAADGPMMVDYSSQAPGKRLGNHAESIDLDDFAAFLGQVQGYDFDVTLEIKDKEASAYRVLAFLRQAE